MDRREFLKSSTGVAALATTGAAAIATPMAVAEPAEASLARPAVHTGPLRLKLSLAWADNGRGPADNARRLARQLEVLSGGRISISVATGDGDAPEETGLWHGPAADLTRHHRAFGYFAGLPGTAGLGRYDTAAWLTVGGGQLLWDDLAADHGFKPLLVGSFGQAGGLWSRHPIAALGDLEALTLHAEGLNADVARALGAVVETRPARNLMDADTLDAVQWGGPLSAHAAGLTGRFTHCLAHGLQRPAPLQVLTVALPVWQNLGAQEQALFSAAASEAFLSSVAETRAHDALMRRVLASQGVRFLPLPVDVGSAVSRVTDAIVAHVASTDAKARRINASYLAFKSSAGRRKSASGVA